MVSDELIMVDKPEANQWFYTEAGNPAIISGCPSAMLDIIRGYPGYPKWGAKKKHKNEHVVSKTTWYYPLDFDHRGFFQGHFHDFRLMEIDGRGIWDTGSPCPPNIGSTLPWVGSWLGQVFQGLCHLRDGNKQETCSKDVSKIYVGIVWIVIVIGLKSEAQKKVRCN